MPRHLFRLALGLALVGLLALAPAGPVEPQIVDRGVTSEPKGVTVARVDEAFGQLPLYFIENQGQLDARVAYYLQGRDSIYFSSEGVTFALTGPAAGFDSDGSRSLAQRMSLQRSVEPEGARQRWNYQTRLRRRESRGDFVRHYGEEAVGGMTFVGGVTKLGSEEAASVLAPEFLNLVPGFFSADRLRVQIRGFRRPLQTESAAPGLRGPAIL